VGLKLHEFRGRYVTTLKGECIVHNPYGIIAALLFAGSLSAATFPIPIVPMQTRIPFGDKGFVAVLGDPQAPPGPRRSITVYRPDGKFAYEVSPRMPSGDDINLGAVAVDSDGTAVVSIFDDPGGPPGSGGLVIVRDGGQAQQFIDTGTYVAESISIAADHTIWSFGNLRRGPNTPVNPGFSMVHHYTADGNPAGEYLPANTFPPLRHGQVIAGGEIGVSMIAASADRVAVYYAPMQAWLELDFSGRLLGRWTLPLPVWHLAFTQDGSLFSNLDAPLRLRRFDRASSSWQLLLAKFPSQMLIGTDGGKLMLGSAVAGTFEVEEFEPPHE
jgi:hypothetical protein